LIGDIDQSIYGWRGARYQNIQDFVENYEDCKVVSLSKNYRSTPQIIKKASNLIRHNSSHVLTRFETDNSDGEPVKCYAFSDQIVEADRVGKSARKLIDEMGWDPEDMAILYRVNKMSEPIEQAMVNHGIPYEVIGARNFYDRLEIRDCMAMLRLLSNPHNGSAFGRVCSLIKGMGAVTIGKIENLAHEKKISIPQACKEMAGTVKSVNISRGCKRLSDIYNSRWDMSKPSVCLDKLVSKLGYKTHLLHKFKETATEREDNVGQLMQAAGEFNGQENGVSKYLQRISLVTNSDKEVKDNKISLMSLHAAKGLEFPIVFMVGVEKDILPHSRATADDPYAGLQEERRLCYVGMTRAKKMLFMTWCKYRRKWGQKGDMTRNKREPSLFLKEAGLTTG
jgi:DNA helicase-2/ATP-dependent DNA helicase PcrA